MNPRSKFGEKIYYNSKFFPGVTFFGEPCRQYLICFRFFNTKEKLLTGIAWSSVARYLFFRLTMLRYCAALPAHDFSLIS